MKCEFDNNIPIYIQLVEELKICIISGEFTAGERLPSVRELALSTKVNPNTMQRALAELENLELVYTERTNGRFVTKDKEIIESYRKEYAVQIAEKFFTGMENIGFNKKEAIEYISKLGGND
ncbi:MAG: GntR family transcriptional regulator [Lachnospiraceae bacterium]|nr:GntR family transcriptional regulator [Lachnospiraceae bacterium]